MPSRIYIIGMMGVGKTAIGKKIASILNYNFIDLDKEIEISEKKSIPEIFEKCGEKYFRKIEAEVLRTFRIEPFVVATGGGTPCFFDTMQFINKNGTSIYIKASEGLIFQRISKHPDKRPLLKGKNETEIKSFIKQTLAKREHFYLQSKFVFDIPFYTPERIIESIDSE